MGQSLKTYYQKRANEYELVYEKPERQADLIQLHEYLKTTFANQTVREIACGTGYWTKTIAQTCKFIHATDINTEVLEIAKTKNYENKNVQFEQKDLWDIEGAVDNMNSLFGGFIWSHILKEELPKFLSMVKSLITDKGQIIFIDNKYVKESSTPISRTDSHENTYQIRRLQNGEEYEVLKNFSTKAEVAELIKDFDLAMEWIDLDYFWILNLNQPH